MSGADFVVIAVTAGLILLAVWKIRRDKKAGRACTGCSGCSTLDCSGKMKL